LGYRSCTSCPIRDAEGKAIGALAIYLKEKRGLDDGETAIMDRIVNLWNGVPKSATNGWAGMPCNHRWAHRPAQSLRIR
jgi:hypothetical protein